MEPRIDVLESKKGSTGIRYDVEIGCNRLEKVDTVIKVIQFPSLYNLAKVNIDSKTASLIRNN